MLYRRNPETRLMHKRPPVQAINAARDKELRDMYTGRAERVGLSLADYCRRFNIQLVEV